MADWHFGIYLSVLVSCLRYKGYQIRTVAKDLSSATDFTSEIQPGLFGRPTTYLRCVRSQKSEDLNHTMVEA